ncbi:hypothetical protein M0R45_024540 [Rubus argutus]|uniref:F-box domain-containing protein n=1 Tax=Rubus argutus TaxID=59490 RepID=A0AAW1WRU4_RUBAR
MMTLNEDLLSEIFCRLSEKDLVTCMSVSRSWHQMSSDVWVRRFWAQSPVLGLYFNTVGLSPPPSPPPSPCPYYPSYWCGMRFISLYNYTYDEDNQVRTKNHRGYRDFLKYKIMMQRCRHFSRLDDDTDNYLDGCNGLLLLLKSGGSTTYHQFYVCNPITRQQVAILKAGVHNRHEHFCAALAFDPLESPHNYRVVRIDYSESVSSSSASAWTTVQVDIFWSKYAQWVRHKVQLDPEFTEGFRTFKLCRHFVYLHGKLYSIAMSWKLLWIDLNTTVIKAGSLKLPTIPEEADEATVGSCLCWSSLSLFELWLC